MTQHPAQETIPAKAPWARRALIGAGLLYGVVLATGIGAVAARETTITTPRLTPDPVSPPGDDLADWRRGATVEVSSYHNMGRHHPIYLIDGLDRASTLEKWTSAPWDEAPWFEVALPAPVDLSGITIAHAGVRESAAYTMDQYAIVCLGQGSPTGRLEIKGNTQAIATHALNCPQTDAVRVTFDLGPKSSPRDLARIYEVSLAAHGAQR